MSRLEHALLDARTLYDVACFRADKEDATKDDVIMKAIALRNWEFIATLEDKS